MILDGLSMMIVNSDLTSRSRLREVIKNCVYKAELSLFQTCKDAIQHLELCDTVDVVLLSFNYGEETLKSIVKDIKGKKGVTSPEFIVTIEQQSSDTSTKVTSLFLDGVAGFIAEPYSSAELTTLLELVKLQRQKTDTLLKNRKAMRFLLQEASKRIDEMAKVLAQPKGNTGFAMRELKNISQTLVALFENDAQSFEEIIIDVFEKVPAPIIHSSQKRGRTKKKVVHHPGKLVTDIMNQRQLTIERLTASLKVELSEFQDFLDCKRSIDDDFSRELARLFGRTPIEWLKLQKEYDFYFETVTALSGQGSLQN